MTTPPNLQHLLSIAANATPGDRIVQPEYNPCRGSYIFAGEDERSGYCLHGLISDPDAQLAAIAPETIRNIVERLIEAEKLTEAAIKWWRRFKPVSDDSWDLIDAVTEYVPSGEASKACNTAIPTTPSETSTYGGWETSL